MPTGRSSTGRRRPTRSSSRTLTKCSTSHMAKLAKGSWCVSLRCSVAAETPTVVDGAMTRVSTLPAERATVGERIV